MITVIILIIALNFHMCFPPHISTTCTIKTNNICNSFHFTSHLLVVISIRTKENVSCVREEIWPSNVSIGRESEVNVVCKAYFCFQSIVHVLFFFHLKCSINKKSVYCLIKKKTCSRCLQRIQTTIIWKWVFFPCCCYNNDIMIFFL